MNLSLFHISHYYSACWQKITNSVGYLPGEKPRNLLFPDEIIIFKIAKDITGIHEPKYAVIATDYFGGIGNQWAIVYKGCKVSDSTINCINDALRHLGVKATNGKDEFDTVGLDRIRYTPEYLEKYIDISEELDV